MKTSINDDIVVSLASYKERLESLPVVINSLLKNSMLPKYIVLNIEDCDIPFLDTNIVKGGDIIKINICYDKLRSHNKYYYVMQEFPDKCIITVDDDTIYSQYTFESLWESYKKYKNCVSALDTNLIKIVDKKIQYPYDLVRLTVPDSRSIAIGWAGVLYPPPNTWIIKKKPNIDDIRKLIMDDDLYLKILEVENDIKVIHAPLLYDDSLSKMIFGVYNSKSALHRINNTDLSRFENINPEIIKKIEEDNNL